MATLVLIVVLFACFLITRQAWKWRLNPMPLFVIAWTPALILTTLPYKFIIVEYNLLNEGVGLLTYLMIFCAFMSFCAGVLCASCFAKRNVWNESSRSAVALSSNIRLWLLFAVGLGIFIYAFAQSGLVHLTELTPDEVRERRLALHLGPISFLVIFLDVTSVIFFAKFMETRRLRYVIPAIVTLICYAATLQKSRVLFVVLSLAFILCLYYREAKLLVAGTFTRKAISILMVPAAIGILLLMNAMRGIGVMRYTDFDSPITEQFFIYSGGTAIINLATAIEGRLEFDDPTYGLVLARPITRHFLDGDIINPTKYFGGINASTFLIYPWSDFRWFGMFITPFLTGLLTVAFLQMALKRSITGLMLGAIGFNAVIFSVNTDVVFDPTVFIIIIITILVHIFATKKHQRNKLILVPCS